MHAAILDLLARICDPLTGIKEVWDILTDEDEDEIKKIADDIRTVVNNFRAEVACAGSPDRCHPRRGGQRSPPRWAATPQDSGISSCTAPSVGHAIDLVGHGTKEFGDEALGFATGLWDISQVRLLFDPVGYFHDLNGMVLGAAPLVGLGPDGAPSVWDSWKTVGKDVSHWDQWDTDPAGAFGRTLFDVATFALPGGPLSKFGTRSRAALDALRDLRKPPLPKLPDPPAIKPPETPEPPPAPAPAGKPPEPGSPAPPPKPGPAPTGTPPPHSPTEPKPSVAPPVSVGKPSVPAGSAAVPHPHESVPARVPVSPGGSPGEPIPAAAAPAASTPAASMPSASAPSAPHLPSPPSAPMGGGAPAEAPLPHRRRTGRA